jgi:hypothetical protein
LGLPSHFQLPPPPSNPLHKKENKKGKKKEEAITDVEIYRKSLNKKKRKETDKEVFLFFFSVGLDRKTSGTSLVLPFALQLKYIGQEKNDFFISNKRRKRKQPKRQHRSVHFLFNKIKTKKQKKTRDI